MTVDELKVVLTADLNQLQSQLNRAKKDVKDFSNEVEKSLGGSNAGSKLGQDIGDNVGKGLQKSLSKIKISGSSLSTFASSLSTAMQVVTANIIANMNKGFSNSVEAIAWSSQLMGNASLLPGTVDQVQKAQNRLIKLKNNLNELKKIKESTGLNEEQFSQYGKILKYIELAKSEVKHFKQKTDQGNANIKEACAELEKLVERTKNITSSSQTAADEYGNVANQIQKAADYAKQFEKHQTQIVSKPVDPTNKASVGAFNTKGEHDKIQATLKAEEEAANAVNKAEEERGPIEEVLITRLARRVGFHEKMLKTVQEEYRNTGNIKILSTQLTSEISKITTGVAKFSGAFLNSLPSMLKDITKAVFQSVGAIIKAAPVLSGIVIGVVASVSAWKKFKQTVSDAVKITLKFSLLGPIFKTIGNIIKKVGSNIKDALTKPLSDALSDFTSTIGNMISKSSEVQKAVSGLKGSFLVAFQPLVSVAIPAITAICNALATLCNWLAKVGAMLSGLTLSGLKKDTQASYELAAGIEAAGGAAEDANNTLGIDELNVISQNSGGGGSSAESIIPDFSGVNGDAFNSFAESFNNLLDKLISGVPTLSNLLTTAAGSMNGFFANLYDGFTNGDVIDKVKILAEGIATSLNLFLQSVDWTIIGQTIGAGLNRAVDFVSTFFSTFNWAAWATAITDSINGFVFEINWQNVGKMIFEGISGALTFVTTLLKTINWAQIGKAVIDLIMGIDWGTLIKQVFDFLWSIVEGTFSLLGGMFKGLVENTNSEVLDAFIPFFEELGTMFSGIGEALTSLWNEIIIPFVSWLWANIGPSITQICKVVANVLSGLLTTVVKIVKDVLTVFQGIITFLNGVFTGDWKKAWEGMKEIFSGVINAICTILDAFGTTFIGAIMVIAEAVKGVFKTTANAIIAVVNVVIGSIEDMLNFIIDGINNISFDVPDWVPKIGGESIGFNLEKINFGRIPYLANGGIVDKGQLFMANERGPELVANYGNQTGVINNDQIVSAVSSGVYQAVMSAMSQSNGTQNINVFLDGKQLESSVRTTAQGYGAQIATGGLINLGYPSFA